MTEEKVHIKSRIPTTLHRAFKKAAIDEHRSMEEIIAQLIQGWLEGREEYPAFTPAMFVEAIANNERPTDEQTIDCAQGVGVDSRKLLEIRDRLFPVAANAKKGAKNA